MRTPITANWRRFVSPLATAAVIAGFAFALGGCGSGSSSDTPPGDSTQPVPTVEVPGAPTNFSVVRTPEVTLSADLSWSAPRTGGAPATYEIYRSTTQGTVFQPDNHLVTVPAQAGETSYAFTDNAGLTAVETYWVVSAKNAGGETPTAEFMYKPIGGGAGGGGDTGYGNNFAAALIFADDVGITGLPISGTWTTDLTQIDVNTGLRPLADQVTALLGLATPVTALPYLDPNTIYPLNGDDYYKQQTASTWQGMWVKGKTEEQHVTAAWGDNLVSQSLSVNSVVRIEMVLSKTLATPMTSYKMESLYGTMLNEIYGTDGTTYPNSTAFVFASNAHLKIQKVDASGTPLAAPLYDRKLWDGDGPGFLGAEVNVAGNFTYGFVWMLNKDTPGYPMDGIWRITFSLDNTSPVATPNNTFIDFVSNGKQVSETEVYIDINVAP